MEKRISEGRKKKKKWEQKQKRRVEQKVRDWWQKENSVKERVREGKSGRERRERERQGGSMIDNGADRTPLAMLSVAVWGDRASPRETELPLATVPAHTPHLVGSPTLGQGSRHHGAPFRTHIPRMLGEKKKETRGLSGRRNNQHFESTSMSLITRRECVSVALTWGEKKKKVKNRRKTFLLSS